MKMWTMMKSWAIALVVGMGMLSTAAWAGDQDSGWEKAYPKAPAGMTRYVLHLPDVKDENAVKLELIVGKTVEVDGVNRHFFGGKIEEKDVEGWGYPRYDVTLGGMASTRMAGPPGAPKVKRLVTLGGRPYLIRYNSRLPVVVYAPEGCEVRYRLWKAEPETKSIDKG